MHFCTPVWLGAIQWAVLTFKLASFSLADFDRHIIPEEVQSHQILRVKWYLCLSVLYRHRKHQLSRCVRLTSNQKHEIPLGWFIRDVRR